MEDPLATTALPSLLTSACIIAVLYKVGELSLLRLVFFTLLPTLAALACIQDKRFLATFHRLFHWFILRVEGTNEVDSTTVDALLAARNELLKSIDRWPAARGRGVDPFSRRRVNPSGSSTDTNASLGVGSGGNNAGKSLYDQVRSHLTDHTFPKNHDAPIYFMDPTTGLFLRVNEQHKLVFTDSPDASCLFHVVKGKTHHWGFHSTIHQRYIGQSVLGKIVVNSKKMQGWESFRILERPILENKSKSHHPSEAGRTVYFVLCSARFGKGMWLGKRRRTPANPTDTYLTKDFAHAIALVYASDLSAFEYLSNPRSSMDSERPSLADSSSDSRKTSSAPSLTASDSETELFGPDFQVPVLRSAERAKVMLPWIEDVSSRRFFELTERQMVEVVSTTVAMCTVREFMEFYIDQDARRMAHEKTSQAPTRSSRSSNTVANGASTDMLAGTPDSQRVSEWHIHPTFGFIRKLCYRPSAAGDGGIPEKSPNPPANSLAASIAIDQFDSCVVDEKSMQKAVFRSKIFTLSVPKSNCFSVEVVFEIQDSVEREGMYALAPMNNVLVFKCRAGVHFTRKTVFASQIEKGVLEGVKNTCDMFLKQADEFRHASIPPSSAIQQSPDLVARTRKDALPRQTLAIEIIKGMINAIRGSDRTGTNIPRRVRSSLNIQMPWTPAPLESAEGPNRPMVGFYESASSRFESVIEKSMEGVALSPSLVFDVLLSDECSFFAGRHLVSGNLEVDIGAWRAARFATDSNVRVQPFIRKQLFRMPVNGVTGLDVVHVEDYQYYALTPSNPQDGERLEFGMKIYARDLPDGERFTIEVLVNIQSSPVSSSEEPASPSSCSIQVMYAIATPGLSTVDSSDDPILAALVHGTVRGLKATWTRVIQVVQDASHSAARISNASTAAIADDIRHRLHYEGHLPSHDELSSKIIEAVTALY